MVGQQGQSVAAVALREVGAARAGAYFGTGPFVGAALAVALGFGIGAIVLAGAAAVEKAAKDGAREGAALVSATEVAEKLTVKVKEGGSDGTGD